MRESRVAEGAGLVGCLVRPVKREVVHTPPDMVER